MRTKSFDGDLVDTDTLRNPASLEYIAKSTVSLEYRFAEVYFAR